MRIVFIGPPGAGKGTQAEKIIAKYKPAHLSTGDMLRAARDAKTEIGVEAEKYMSSGQLVPDAVVIGVIADRLKQDDCKCGYLLDGFPRTIAQAEALDKMLAEAGTPLDVVLELKNVSHIYNANSVFEKIALDDVSLKIFKGEIAHFLTF